MIRPSCGVGWREFVEMICPTGEAKYFCKGGSTQKCPTGKSPHGRESKFHSCPGRGAALFALPRRAGTHSRASATMDPGSAAHHAASHSASKTRVNALMALRSIRGTTGAPLKAYQTAC